MANRVDWNSWTTRRTTRSERINQSPCLILDGFTTGLGRGRSGHRCEESRRLHNTTGQQYVYEDRDLFVKFCETTMQIAGYQSKLDEERYSSKRIRRLYQKQMRYRDHVQDALIRNS